MKNKIGFKKAIETLEEAKNRGHNIFVITSANSETGEQMTLLNGQKNEILALIIGTLCKMKKNEDIDDETIDIIAEAAKDVSYVGESYEKYKEKDEDESFDDLELDEIIEETKKLLNEISEKLTKGE